MNGFVAPWILHHVFCFIYESKAWEGDKVNTGSFTDKKLTNSQEMHWLLHLFMSEFWGELGWSVGITSISHQASVFRLHVVYIDFSLLLLKCTINQYSNKSSFILEKCSFQLSGHNVPALSLWPGKQRPALGLGPHLPYTWYHSGSWQNKAHTAPYNVQYSTIQWILYTAYMYCGCSWVILKSLLHFLLFTHNNKFIAHRHNPLEKKQWFIWDLVFFQGHTPNRKQKLKVFLIHLCQDFSVAVVVLQHNDAAFSRQNGAAIWNWTSFISVTVRVSVQYLLWCIDDIRNWNMRLTVKHTLNNLHCINT